MEHFDAAIIGSGISALSSALLFSKRGKKTAVFEQAAKIAPLLAGFDRKGFHFETGFHYSGAIGAQECGGFLFRELGIDVPVEECDSDGYDILLLQDSQREFKMPFGRKNMESRLNEFFPKESAAINKYLNLMEEEIAKSPFLNMRKRNYSNEEFLLWDGDKTAVSQVLDKCFKDDEIKTVLSFSQLLYGVPPSQCSFMFHCCCAGIMQESVWKIKGGAMTFVKAAQAALLSKGAKLFTNKKVVKISVEKNKKILFFEDGDAISADIAVSSIAPKEFIKIMPEGTYRKAAIERIQSAKDTIGFFTLYGAAKEDLRYENINSLAAAKKQDYLSDFKDAFYVNFQDKGAVCAAMSVNSEEKFWDIPKDRYIEIKERYSAELKNKISQNWSGLLDKIDFLESSAPATMKRYVNYYGAYGFKHSLDSVNIAPITKTPGLYLIGQAVVTPGLLGAMISSFLLDKIIFNRDGSK